MNAFSDVDTYAFINIKSYQFALFLFSFVVAIAIFLFVLIKFKKKTVVKKKNRKSDWREMQITIWLTYPPVITVWYSSVLNWWLLTTRLPLILVSFRSASVVVTQGLMKIRSVSVAANSSVPMKIKEWTFFINFDTTEKS